MRQSPHYLPNQYPQNYIPQGYYQQAPLNIKNPQNYIRNQNYHPKSQYNQLNRLNQSRSAQLLNRPIQLKQTIQRDGIIKGQAIKAPIIRQTIYQEQPLNIPPPMRQIQYIPHQNRYIDYVQKRIKVPIQRYYTDYYEVQHVTDFVPREYQQTVVQMVPEETIRYRLQYVPVQNTIIHFPKGHIYQKNGILKGMKYQMDFKGTNQQVNIKKDVNKLLFQGLEKQILKQDAKQYSNINKQIFQNLGKLNKIPQQQMSFETIVSQGIRKKIQDNQSKQYDNLNKQIFHNRNKNISESVVTGLERINYPNYNHSISYNQNIQNNNTRSRQVLNEFSRNTAKSRLQTSRTSRKRTNFVTSDGYFPTYDQQLRRLQNIRPRQEQNRQYENSYQGGYRESNYQYVQPSY